MSKTTPTLQAQTRERLGTRYTKRLRATGKLPAILYGHGSKPLPLQLDAKQTLHSLKAGAHVLNIALEGGTTETCLVKELQFGWLGDDVIHLDLTRVNLDEVVKVKVHLNYFGQPESAKKPGAVLTHDVTELEVSCKVRDIPEEIRIDLTHMKGDLLTVGEFKLPEGLTAITDSHTAYARVIIVQEELAAEAVAPTGAAEPEVLTAKKDKVEGAEGAAPAEKKDKEDKKA
ncbi:MAG: 50S ribosomal protein L25 [Planctomycetes bacterium]|nr:50S ribosomal protein L25 [Planctomycetota bacterium]